MEELLRAWLPQLEPSAGPDLITRFNAGTAPGRPGPFPVLHRAPTQIGLIRKTVTFGCFNSGGRASTIFRSTDHSAIISRARHEHQRPLMALSADGWGSQGISGAGAGPAHQKPAYDSRP
jgi:hypothetical protein